MLVALDSEEGRILAMNSTREEEYFCPGCRENVFPRKGSIKAHHFAHYPHAKCTFTSGETQAHIGAKLGIFTSLAWASKYFDQRINSIDTEKRLNSLIADIYFKLSNTEVVVEIQHSHILKEEIYRRMYGHMEAGRYTIWVKPYLSDWELNNSTDIKRQLKYKLEGKQQLKDWELYLHSLYFGRTYYVLANTSFAGAITPVHWLPVKEDGKFLRATKYASIGKPRSSIAAGFQPADVKKTNIHGHIFPTRKIWEDKKPAWWEKGEYVNFN